MVETVVEAFGVSTQIWLMDGSSPIKNCSNIEPNELNGS